MEFTLEGLVLAIVAILPGFVRTAARQVIAPETERDTADWVAGSIVGSLVLNAVMLPVFVVYFHSLDLTKDIGSIKQAVLAVSGWRVLGYLGALYGLAVVSGLLAGAFAAYSPRELAYRLRLTPISPASNVFNDVLDDLMRRASRPRPAPWIRVRRKDTLILGRLNNSSVDFDVDKPIEIFLDRVTLQRRGTLLLREPNIEERFQGLYLRLLPDDLVEILLAPPEWDPFPLI